MAVSTTRAGRRASAPALVLPAVLSLGSPAGAQDLAAEMVGPLIPGSGVTFVAQPPGNTRDLLLLEKRGRIRLIRDGALIAAPVLDLVASVNDQFEGGLLGLAFHPQFAANGLVYVCYTGHPLGTMAEPPVRIVRYSLDPSDPSAALPGSARDVLVILRTITLPAHCGGWIGFGPDGYLYVSSGDGAGPAQATGGLGGKILRIDVDQDAFPSDPLANYGVPPTNPFFGTATARQEIWALGLRNPWRCSFDRLTGDLWIGDVGENAREEVDFQPAIGAPPYTARNYGWPCTEGTLCTGYAGCTCHDPSHTPPVLQYGRGPGTAGIIGGYVYRGAAIPELQGAYLFADLGGQIWSFRRTPGGPNVVTDLTWQLGATQRWSFGEGSDGELYFVRGDQTGHRIAKIVRACPANCDGSPVPPVLNVADFVCFTNRYAAGHPYANCDGSTVPPVLNVEDFICYMNRYAAGCP